MDFGIGNNREVSLGFDTFDRGSFYSVNNLSSDEVTTTTCSIDELTEAFKGLNDASKKLYNESGVSQMLFNGLNDSIVRKISRRGFKNSFKNYATVCQGNYLKSIRGNW